jgi:hypothetical protein
MSYIVISWASRLVISLTSEEIIQFSNLETFINMWSIAVTELFWILVGKKFKVNFKGPLTTEQVDTTIVWNVRNYSPDNSLQNPEDLNIHLLTSAPAQHNLISSMLTATHSSQHQENYCNQNTSERIKLKCILQKYDVKLCAGFIWF